MDAQGLPACPSVCAWWLRLGPDLCGMVTALCMQVPNTGRHVPILLKQSPMVCASI